MAKEESKPKEKSSKLTKAEKLGPARFTSQQDYEEQVALEKGPESEEKPVEEKPVEEKKPEEPVKKN